MIYKLPLFLLYVLFSLFIFTSPLYAQTAPDPTGRGCNSNYIEALPIGTCDQRCSSPSQWGRVWHYRYNDNSTCDLLVYYGNSSCTDPYNWQPACVTSCNQDYVNRSNGRVTYDPCKGPDGSIDNSLCTGGSGSTISCPVNPPDVGVWCVGWSCGYNCTNTSTNTCSKPDRGLVGTYTGSNAWEACKTACVLPVCTCQPNNQVACGAVSITPTNSPCTGSCNVTGTKCPAGQTCNNGVCQSPPTVDLRVNNAGIGTKNTVITLDNRSTVYLTWTSTNNPTNCTATGSAGTWSWSLNSPPNNLSSGTTTASQNNAGTYIYNLECSNSAGSSGIKSVAVTVNMSTN